MVAELNRLQEFNHHKAVMSVYNETDGTQIGFIAIHRGSDRFPAFGATRIWQYSSREEALRDALRLSRLMSYKSALAGLPYGGAKAVLFDIQNTKEGRKQIIKHYSHYINYLRGGFITGADAGVSAEDLELMLQESKYIVGKTSDPVRFTVLGLYDALQACLTELFGTESIEGRSFAIQGLGKTGYALLKLLYNDARRIVVTDVDEDKILRVKEKFPKIEVVAPSEIFQQKVDVYSPCAIGYAFTLENVSSLRCKVIVGTANNQLEYSEVGDQLFKNGILYAPDYVVNAGGLIAVAEEYENQTISVTKIEESVSHIKDTLHAVINESKVLSKATNRVADAMAERIFDGIK